MSFILMNVFHRKLCIPKFININFSSIYLFSDVYSGKYSEDFELYQSFLESKLKEEDEEEDRDKKVCLVAITLITITDVDNWLIFIS